MVWDQGNRINNDTYGELDFQKRLQEWTHLSIQGRSALSAHQLGFQNQTLRYFKIIATANDPYPWKIDELARVYQKWERTVVNFRDRTTLELKSVT